MRSCLRRGCAKIRGVPSTVPHSGAYSRLLRRSGYPGFVLTVSLSRTGVTMFGVAGVLLVLRRTGSAPLAGATAAAMLPAALSGPLLGAWLDVARSRRLLMVIDQLSSVACLLALVALAGRAPNWTLPAVAVIYSVTRPFSSASFFSAMAEIVGPELLDHASAIEASSLNLSFVLGPALAGAIAGAAGPAAAIEVQAAIMLAAAIVVAINPAFEARPDVRARSAGEAFRAGTRALVGNHVLRNTAGFLEGPAHSGTIALRQRLTPPAVRGQVLTTLSSAGMVAASAGAAIGGLMHDVTAPIVSFAVINLLAAAIAVRGDRSGATPERALSPPRR